MKLSLLELAVLILLYKGKPLDSFDTTERDEIISKLSDKKLVTENPTLLTDRGKDVLIDTITN